MAYSITVERIGEAGTPDGGAVRYEVQTEIEAIAIATCEVDAGGAGPHRVATVFNEGRLVLAYAGRAQGAEP